MGTALMPGSCPDKTRDGVAGLVPERAPRLAGDHPLARQDAEGIIRTVLLPQVGRSGLPAGATTDPFGPFSAEPAGDGK